MLEGNELGPQREDRALKFISILDLLFLDKFNGNLKKTIILTDDKPITHTMLMIYINGIAHGRTIHKEFDYFTIPDNLEKIIELSKEIEKLSDEQAEKILFIGETIKSINEHHLESKMMFINYPNNPTSAVADGEFYEKVIKFAKKYNIIVCSDAAYSEMYYDNKKPISFLELKGAKDIGVEFHSVSKTYNMTGWRLGWVCGNAEIVAGLGKVKDNYDSGVFGAIQEAGITALTSSQDCVEEMRRIYQNRRDIFIDELSRIGWSVNKPQATFYVWAKVPKGYKSAEVIGKLLDEAGIVCTPGNGFGPSGEGYIRFALTVPEARLKQAVERISKIKW